MRRIKGIGVMNEGDEGREEVGKDEEDEGREEGRDEAVGVEGGEREEAGRDRGRRGQNNVNN